MVKFSFKSILTLLAAGTCLFSLRTANAQVYHVYDLGTLGGASSNATAINNNGQIVGYSEVFPGPFLRFVTSAFRHSGTGPLVKATDDLGSLGGLESYAYAINNVGTVVGTSMDTVGNFQVFRVADPGTLTPAHVTRNTGVIGDDYGDLGDGSGLPGDGYGVASAINDNDEFAGYSRFAGMYAYQHLHGQGALFNRLQFMIAPEEGESYAYGINDSGAIVGKIQDDISANLYYHAFFIWEGNYTMWSDMGTLGGNNSVSLAVNDTGVTVGWSELTKGSATHHAFRHLGTATNNSLFGVGKLSETTDDLGTLGGYNSQANAVNSRNVAVGASEWYKFAIRGHAQQVNSHAFVYSTSMIDMNTVLDASSSGWVLTEANGINDNDWVVGQGIINGEYHAFVAIPEAVIKG